MFKVIATSPTFGRYGQEPVEMLQRCGAEVIYVPAEDRRDQERLARWVADADALIVGTELITAEILESAGRLQIIAKHGAGIDNIDLKAAAERGIFVTNAPGQNAGAVADLAFGLVLASARGIVNQDRRVRTGQWQPFIGKDVRGRTLGIVGVGQIGKGLAERARGFGMEVLGYDLYPDHAFSERTGLTWRSLPDLLSESDFVSLHVSFSAQAALLIDAAALRMMKPTAFLINTSRGQVVDEAALYTALTEKWIAGAALDVFASEPPGENPLLNLDSVIATPHMAAYTEGAMQAVGMVTAVNVCAVLQGEQPPNAVKYVAI